MTKTLEQIQETLEQQSKETQREINKILKGK